MQGLQVKTTRLILSVLLVGSVFILTYFQPVMAEVEGEEVLSEEIEEDSVVAECGTIGIESFGEIEVWPIEDCDNRFGIENHAPSGWYSILADGEEVGDGNTIIIESDTEEIVGSLQLNDAPEDVLHHTVRIYYEDGDYLHPVYNEWINEFPAEHIFQPVATGTYHVLIQPVEVPILVKAEALPWSKQVTNLLLPRAFAQLSHQGSHPIWYRSFSIEEEVEKDGPPSVLFLPGIQASRLYQGDGGQVWPPTNNDDVRDLAMDENGESVRDIRTKDVVDEVLIPLLGTNIYKSFLEQMNQAVDEEQIAAFSAFPYDWRYSVRDIVEDGTVLKDGSVLSLIAEVERLADLSGNGQVAIVAHSNGGLLAKALSDKLKETGQADLLDSITLLGVPHIGTPKALATILHGYDQEKVGGLVIEDAVARSVIKNMPGVYSLLPSERYLQLFGPTIYFTDSTSTAPFVEAYDYDLNNLGEYQQFLTGEDSGPRVEGGSGEIHIPTTANDSMLEQALTDHSTLYDSWTPPNGVETYNIVGTGAPTVEAIRYRELEELQCPPGQMHLVAVCTHTPVLKPLVQFTTMGDETVVSRSAAYGDEVDTWFVDLKVINEGFLNSSEITHLNLTESDTVLEALKNIFNEQSLEELDFIFKDEPMYDNPLRLATIDSPVTFLATDTDGNRTGRVAEGGESVVVEEIPSSAYFEIGETKYLLMPEGIEYTMTLEGEEDGYYTYSLGTVRGNEQEVQTMLKNATTTQNMVATYTVVDGETSTMQVDFDGDGKVDLEQTLSGEIIKTDTEDSADNQPETTGGGGTLLVDTPALPEGEVAGIATGQDVDQELLRQLIEALERYLALLKQYESQ